MLNSAIFAVFTVLYTRTGYQKHYEDKYLNYKDDDLEEDLRDGVRLRRKVLVATKNLDEAQKNLVKVQAQLQQDLKDAMAANMAAGRGDLTDEEKVRFTEAFRLAVKEAKKSIADAQQAFKRAQEQTKFLNKARKDKVKADLSKMVTGLKGLARIKAKFKFAAEQSKKTKLGLMAKNERIIVEAEEKELTKLNIVTKALYGQLKTYGKERMADLAAGFMFPARTWVPPSHTDLGSEAPRGL